VAQDANVGRDPYAYLRVIAPGAISAGDEIVVSHRPEHQVTVAVMFRGSRSNATVPSVLAAAILP
jgi:MOSC domain-containing protein YiiM